MRFFKEHVVGIFILSIAASIVASFIYDHWKGLDIYRLTRSVNVITQLGAMLLAASVVCIVVFKLRPVQQLESAKSINASKRIAAVLQPGLEDLLSLNKRTDEVLSEEAFVRYGSIIRHARDELVLWKRVRVLAAWAELASFEKDRNLTRNEYQDKYPSTGSRRTAVIAQYRKLIDALN